MVLKKFFLPEVCLLKKEAKALSASNYVSLGSSNSSDSLNAVANECLLKKLAKENCFLRKCLRNKDVVVTTLIKDITDLNKE